MKKTTFTVIVSLIIIIVLISALWVINSSRTKTNNHSIKVGVILPLSGPAAFSGLQAQKGLDLAIAEINQQNQNQIELIYQDSKANPEQSVTAFNNLINLHDSDVIISSLSSVSMAIAPLAQEKQIPLIATIATTPDLTKQNQWTYRYYPIADQEIPPLVSVANELKLNKIAVLHLNDDFGLSMKNTLAEKFKGEVISQSFAISDQDFKSALTKLKTQDPDGLLVVGFSSHIINGFKQAQELGVKVTYFAPSSAAFADIRKSINEIGIEVYAGIPQVYGEKEIPKIKEIKKQIDNFDHYVATGYDLGHLIKQVSNNSKGLKQEIKNNLDNLENFNGILGSVLLNNHELNFPLDKALIKNGEIKYLK